MHHFGQGLVATPADFGRLGSAPTIQKCSIGGAGIRAAARLEPHEVTQANHELDGLSTEQRAGSVANGHRSRQSLLLAQEHAAI